jgi:hypothetical protein
MVLLVEDKRGCKPFEPLIRFDVLGLAAHATRPLHLKVDLSAQELHKGKTTKPHNAAKLLILLVGRVGLEPTTNGL